MVAYHGTPNKFDTFDKNKIGTATDSGFFGEGFYFADYKGEAEYYGNIVTPVYLKIQNPIDIIDVAGGYYWGLYDNMFEKGALMLNKFGLLDESDRVALKEYQKRKKEFLDKANVYETITFDAQHNEIKIWAAEIEKNGRMYYERSYDADRYVGKQEEQSTKENALNNLWNRYFHENDDMLRNFSFTDYIRMNGLSDKFSEKVKQLGYDGVIAGDEYIAFEPNQIKSVDNRGTFDINNPNIYYQTIWAKKTDVTTKTDPKQMRYDAEKYLKDVTTTLGKIRVSKKGIDEFLNYTGNLDKLALVPHLKNLIETSVVGKKEELKHTRSDGIIAFYHLYNDAVIDGKPYDVTTKIGVDENGNLFYLLLLDEKNNSLVSKTGTKSNPNKGAINLTISQSEPNVNNRLYQKAYVSMKGELVGDYLDADMFEGTGENASAHGWGNYLLKDRKTNKVRYFDRWNERKVFYKGNAVDFDSIRDLVEYYIDKKQEENLSDKELLELINAEIERFEKHLNDEKQTMERLKKEYSLNEKLLDDIKEYAKNDGNVGYEIRERIYNNLDNRAIYTNWFRAYKSYLRINKNIEQLKKLSNINMSDIEIKNSAAQYEAEVPEDKYLLDEDLPLNKQSDYVQEKLKDVFNELKFPKKKEVIFNDPKTAKETYDIQMNLYQRNGYGYERLAPEIDDLPDGRIVIRFVENFNFYQTDEYTWKMSGRDAYDSFARYLKSQKSASKLLEKHGIKGIKYDGERDGIGYVIFKGADAPITRRLLQRAFAASRVDYEKPSLEYIGSGEGNQAHGWGLYYALRREIAERYRINFTVREHINDLVSKYMGLYRGIF